MAHHGDDIGSAHLLSEILEHGDLVHTVHGPILILPLDPTLWARLATLAHDDREPDDPLEDDDPAEDDCIYNLVAGA